MGWNQVVEVIAALKAESLWHWSVCTVC